MVQANAMDRLFRAAVVVSSLALVGVRASADVEQGVTAFNEARYGDAVTILRDQSGPQARAYLAASLVRLSRAGSADEKRARLAEAEPAAREVLAAQPGNAVAAAALGEALVAEERADDAIAAMSAVLAAQNDVAYAYYWRGKAYNVKKQTARLVDDLQHFLKLAPQAPAAAAVRSLLQALQ